MRGGGSSNPTLPYHSVKNVQGKRLWCELNRWRKVPLFTGGGGGDWIHTVEKIHTKHDVGVRFYSTSWKCMHGLKHLFYHLLDLIASSRLMSESKNFNNKTKFYQLLDSIVSSRSYLPPPPLVFLSSFVPVSFSY